MTRGAANAWIGTGLDQSPFVGDYRGGSEANNGCGPSQRLAQWLRSHRISDIEIEVVHPMPLQEHESVRRGGVLGFSS
jgi:hypothetical protein